MTPLEGSYYDGKSSRQHRVTIHREAPGHLRVTGEGIDFSCRLSEVRASSRLGNTRRYLAFADGSRCEVDDNDAIDALFYDAPKAGLGRLLHHFETRLGYVLLALLLTVVALWAGVVHGIPALAKGIAFNLPVATDRMLGEEALTGLDATLLEPTRLPPRRQMELRTLFADMTAGIPGAAGYRIELRASKAIGANALALPSGLVVMTDSLVELAACDDELVAVLAHEIGHLEQRHGLRRVLQDSATALVVIAVTGDIGSLVSLTAALPALVLQSKYSRDFETEADDFARAYLARRGIPVDALTAILLRMEQKAGRSNSAPDYLSSHPATRERVERARAPR